MQAWHDHACPFVEGTCSKTLSDKTISGVCTLAQMRGMAVICCPKRLYADNHWVIKQVARQCFPDDLPVIPGQHDSSGLRDRYPDGYVMVFGKGFGKELHLPSRGQNAGAYFIDWVLVHVDGNGALSSFVAAEVQSIDTTGNYRDERAALLAGNRNPPPSTAGFNWENVNKRILPQLIYKGQVLRREKKCANGLYFICPVPVYDKIMERLGGSLEAIHRQPGSLTILKVGLGPAKGPGHLRALSLEGQFTTTIDSLALAFTAPRNLPPAGVYEAAILAEL
jgi:hypothetical protein